MYTGYSLVSSRIVSHSHYNCEEGLQKGQERLESYNTAGYQATLDNRKVTKLLAVIDIGCE